MTHAGERHVMHRSFKSHWLAANAACALAGVAAGATPSPPDADEARLLLKPTLLITVAGTVTGSFAKAYGIIQASNVLESIQGAYATQLPAGEKPEFEVHSFGAGRYYYVNRHRERCDVRELWRQTDTNSWIKTAFYVKGERAFGTFESLIYLTVRREPVASQDQLTYATVVRVWPHGAVIRMFLRHMPRIERYFRKKTDEMREIMTGVFDRLVGPGAK